VKTREKLISALFTEGIEARIKVIANKSAGFCRCIGKRNCFHVFFYVVDKKLHNQLLKLYWQLLEHKNIVVKYLKIVLINMILLINEQFHNYY
jgi:hypothetical protein